MKIEALKKRLNHNRPMTSVTIRMPEDVVEDLSGLRHYWDFLAISH